MKVTRVYVSIPTDEQKFYVGQRAPLRTYVQAYEVVARNG